MDRPTTPGSLRSAVYAPNGMCATSQPLATLAGVQVLKNGGTAADAAICMLNTLSVVEPFMNGPGGDMFGLYYDADLDELAAINASGPAPAALDSHYVQARGHERMPDSGPLSVTVPGALAGLAALHKRFGRQAWGDLFQPAIEYALDGFPLSEIISFQWQSGAHRLPAHRPDSDLYLPGGKAPGAGERFCNRALARTLTAVARDGIDTFYRGEYAQRICRALRSQGCPLDQEDLNGFRPEWVQPLSVDYHGWTVNELPPNCQGITVLEMLKLLEKFDLAAMGLNSADYIHTLVEAKKFAYHDRDTRLGDPRRAEIDCHYLLSGRHLDSFSKNFDPQRASNRTSPGLPASTVYAVAVDRQRNAASFISSIFDYFGSGIVAGDTGVIMQNRGALFSLDRQNPNFLEPGKRPLHTIIPAMVFQDRKPCLAFGVMGGHMQPQGHVQILNNLHIFGQGIQAASDLPRFFHDGELLNLESGIPTATREELVRRGHRLGDQTDVFGGFQGILIDYAKDVLVGGSDGRKDGCALGY